MQAGWCNYQDEEISKCKPCGCKQTCFPYLFPKAINAPCCSFGMIVSLQHKEEPLCPCSCGMGKKGATACICLAPPVLLGGVPPGVPINFSIAASVLTTIQCEQMIQMYQLKTHHQVPCCYPIGLYRHYMFLRALDKKLSAKKATPTI